MAQRTTKFFCLVAATIIFAGCSSSKAPGLPQLDDTVRIPLNQNLRADPTTSKRYSRMRVSITQVVELYVPADVKVYSDESVDMATLLNYDNSRPWTESMGAALAAVRVEMVADLAKKTVLLKSLPLTLAHVLETRIPADYKVYLDAGVSTDTVVKFDPRKPWVEELGKALNGVGYDLIANLDKKIVLVRPIPPKTPLNAQPRGVQTVKQLAPSENSNSPSIQETK